jgi:hypothetical protein
LFVLSALVYPALLAALCMGTALGIDRASGGILPGSLLAVVGMAALIAASEWTTYLSALAPATPYVLAALALGGLFAGRQRLRREHRRAIAPLLGACVLAYVIAAAPVLFAGRPTFSAYMVLTDSAVHMIGADYLIRHGQQYGHLDLLNSYGLYLSHYYANSYPTGSDVLLGGSAALVRVPVIWAFQPFNALVLALGVGPAWLLARRIGLAGGWALAAAVIATVPALVYAYDLIGSIKEITALPLVLALGALTVEHRRWIKGGPRAAIPFALVTAAGVSALGLAFGVWTGATVAILAVVVLATPGQRRRLLALAASGAAVLVVCAWPTWRHLGTAFQITQAIATTPNRGNLVSPLNFAQTFGAWLQGNYQLRPAGTSLAITDLLIGISALAAIAGALRLLLTRRRTPIAWIGVMLALGFILTRIDGTWSNAKTLVLSSPILILLAWAAVGALVSARRRAAALVLAAVLAGGVLVSDFIQYHDTNLAPTARYDELASVGARFGGRGPALFTDFDEYSMYELRNLDVGGPDFIYPPAHLAGIDTGHGNQVDVTRGRSASLRAYPLIVTRRDPLAIRPPSAYNLLWQGLYYQVWGRRRGAEPAIARMRLTGRRVVACSRVRAIAVIATARRATLYAATPSESVVLDLRRAQRPRGWRREGTWYLIASGQLRARLRLRHPGAWDVWLQGEFMRTVAISLDGRTVGSIGGQVGGDAVVPETSAPTTVRLAAGSHTLALALSGASLGPGGGSSDFLSSIFLTPAGAGGSQQVRAVAPAAWRSLCGHRYVWIEAVPTATRVA